MYENKDVVLGDSAAAGVIKDYFGRSNFLINLLKRNLHVTTM